MRKISVTDFSGGIQEAYSPDDFSERQSAILKGFIPDNETMYRSQWPAQLIGTDAPEAGGYNADFNAVWPLESSVGTFLVGIKTNGELWWCKVPVDTAGHTATKATKWYLLSYDADEPPYIPNFDTGTRYSESNGRASNWGWDNDYVEEDPTFVADTWKIKINPTPDYKFITGLPFETYKYTKMPLWARQTDVTQDVVSTAIIYDLSGDNVIGEAAALSNTAQSICSGVLIGCRRRLLADGSYGITDSTGGALNAGNQHIIVAYVDPRMYPTYDSDEPGTIRIASFPNFRRWPTRPSFTGTTRDTWPEHEQTVNGVTSIYGEDEKSEPMSVRVVTPRYPIGTKDSSTSPNARSFRDVYPFTETVDGITWNARLYPDPRSMFHPYTYLTPNTTATLKDGGALLPGTGIIPRANIGTMWGNQLILGDIEWRSDKAISASNTKPMVQAGEALQMTLNESNTEPHRGSFYYSEDDIDKFDPRHVVRVATSDARIAGMYVLDNRLVCITTAGGPDDGVISYSGNLGQLLPYSGTPNPYAIRRQLVRGGIGVADTVEGTGHVTQSCLWGETGTAVFIDKLGGVFYTNGVSCDRLDRIGPKTPRSSNYQDHVAAVGKYLFVWRDGRLLVLSVLSSTAESASSSWSELVTPNASQPNELKSMIGSGQQMFMVVNGSVWRYTLNGPDAERGCIDGQPYELTVGTATFGDATGHSKTNWFRTGVSFYTNTSCYLESVTTKSEAALSSAAPSPSPNPSPAPSHTVIIGNSYSNGHYDFMCPAGIGSQTVVSAIFTFSGDVVLNGVSLITNGGFMERGEP
jgi:hypothetical protein